MTRALNTFADIHSHQEAKATAGDTVVSQAPGMIIRPEGWYSVGIHPWETASGKIPCPALRALARDARSERVVAIGEAGIDRLRGGSLDEQIALFRLHARLARRVSKPLIIHCVRAYDLLLAEAKLFKPRPGEWIIHGFRGKPRLAQQLLNAGIDISLGLHHHPDLPGTIIPPDRLYRESDEITTSDG